MATESADPTEVHPEHERPTPQNIDDWSDDQLERFNELNEDRMEGEVREQAKERRRELDQTQEQAVEALTAPAKGDHETIELVEGREIEVKTYFNAATEDAIDIAVKPDAPLEMRVEKAIEAITWLVTDDVYSDPDIWWAYYDERGWTGLQSAFRDITDPAFTRMQERDVAGNSDELTEDS